MCFSFVDYSYFRTETPHLSLSLSIPLLIVMQLRKCLNDFLSIPNHCDSCVMARPHNPDDNMLISSQYVPCRLQPLPGGVWSVWSAPLQCINQDSVIAFLKIFICWLLKMLPGWMRNDFLIFILSSSPHQRCRNSVPYLPLPPRAAIRLEILIFIGFGLFDLY